MGRNVTICCVANNPFVAFWQTGVVRIMGIACLLLTFSMGIHAQEPTEKTLDVKKDLDVHTDAPKMKFDNSIYMSNGIMLPMGLQFKDISLEPLSLTSPFNNKVPQLNSSMYSHTENMLNNNYNNYGVLSYGKSGILLGGSSHTTMYGLMDYQNSELNLIKDYGNLRISVGVSANRYMILRNIETQFGISGALSYKINENLSVSAFGQYNSNPFYSSMAAYPYIGTSSYGSYFTLHNNKTGIDLGVKRLYDPFRRQWRTQPIVTPKFKVGKTTVGIELGEVVGEALNTLFHKKTDNYIW